MSEQKPYYKATKAGLSPIVGQEGVKFPAGVRYVFWDEQGRRCTQFVCECPPATGRNSDEDAARIAELLNADPRDQTIAALRLELTACHSVGLRQEREIAELRESLLVARLEEARWWEHLVGYIKPDHSENHDPDCMYCQRIAELEAALAKQRAEIKS
jgi:hypothetical protein